MKTFTQFINEDAIATKRINMIHLQKMKDEDFIEFVQSIKSTMNGKLENLKVQIKADGIGSRFGRDATGRVFYEGSRTGPIYTPKAFSSHARGRGAVGEILARAEHYDDIFDIITQSKFAKELPLDCKVICEIFYNPMSQIEGDGIKFISIKYDKNKLGNVMSIIPFAVVSASTGEPLSNAAEIIDSLFKYSTSDIKFIDPKLQTSGAIDISGLIDPIMSLNSDSLTILKSRKTVDREAKQNLRDIIQSVKDSLADYILRHENILDKFKLGPEIEGLVLDINGQTVKVTTPEFKASKQKEKHDQI